MRVGIPRALLFWIYAPLWLAFLRELGAEPVVTGETTRGTLDAGVRLAVDEACLPVKICYGHCQAAVEASDLVFLPRLVSVEPRAYICPKFMGLPDMVRHALGREVRLLAPVVDLRRGRRGLDQAAGEVATALGKRPREAGRALARALAVQRAARERWERGTLPSEDLEAHGFLPRTGLSEADSGVRNPAPPPAPRRLGILGHPYNVYDRLVSLDLLRRLSLEGWTVTTAESIPADDCAEGARELPKELFWTLGRRVYGAAAHLMTGGELAGLVHLVSFGCGPDSLVGELVARRAEESGVPFLLLTLDEHTGEAGAWTRVEAFLDLIERREVRGARQS